MTPRRRVIVIGVVLATASVALAQQTDDLAEEDRRYLERIRAQSEQPKPPPDPEEAREETVRRFLETADELIRDKNYRSAETPRYRVKSDDPRLDVDAVASLLESFRTWFDAFWQDRAELLPYDGPSRMYLFWSYYKYNRLFSGKERFDEFKTSGHYRGLLDVIVVHTDGTAPADLADTLVHEAAHQLVQQRLLGDEANAPPWLNEGMADYFGLTEQAADGRWIESDVGAKAVWPFREIRRSRPAAARGRLQDLDARLEEGDGRTVDFLLRADPAAFYGPSIRGNYAVSWVLVHYLFHGEDGRYAAPFVDWIVRDVRGDGTRSLTEALGVDVDALEAGLAAHARRIRPR